MTYSEAPRSVNFYGITKTGWNCQWTIRADTNEELIKEQGDLKAFGVVPKAVGRQPESPVSPDTPPTKSAAPKQELMFDAVELEGSTKGDRTYWKVKGGKFSKYGVTIWPEVLEAADFAVEELDPARTYDLEGYTAYYVEKDDGKPDKVVNLAK